MLEEREASLKEIYRGGILPDGIEGMNSYCTTADGIVAASAAARSDETERASTDGDAANCHPTDRDEEADSTAAERKHANGAAAGGEDPSCQAAASEPAGRDIAEGKDSSSVAAPFAAFEIWSSRDRPKWQAAEFARGLAADAFEHAGELLA